MTVLFVGFEFPVVETLCRAPAFELRLKRRQDCPHTFFVLQIACTVFLVFLCTPLQRQEKNGPLVPLARNWCHVCQAVGSRHLKCGARCYVKKQYRPLFLRFLFLVWEICPVPKCVASTQNCCGSRQTVFPGVPFGGVYP